MTNLESRAREIVNKIITQKDSTGSVTWDFLIEKALLSFAKEYANEKIEEIRESFFPKAHPEFNIHRNISGAVLWDVLIEVQKDKV